MPFDLYTIILSGLKAARNYLLVVCEWEVVSLETWSSCMAVAAAGHFTNDG